MADDDLYEGLGGGNKPAGGFGAPRGVPPTAMGRLMTSRGVAPGGEGGPRPMTSVRAAGFQSAAGKANALGAISAGSAAISVSGPAPALAEKTENGPEEVAKDMELKVHHLIEACAEAAARGDYVMALERAKEAGRKERQLVKFKDSNGLSDAINMDLTYCCAFNLAQAYHLNKMYAEALNTYSLIVKNKQYQQSGRLRVNMGNIYYEDKKYPQAIKMYRMALDQIPPSSRELRLRIQRNIGHAFVRMGQFQDAISAFETMMDASPEFQAGFNLVICYYALGDVELMKKGFQRLLEVPLPEPDDDEEDDKSDDEDEVAAAAKLELTRDPLKEEIRTRQKTALAYVTNAAKLLAPVVAAPDWQAGYDWVIEQLKRDHPSVASELQISKALEFMSHKEFDRAIEDLKAFEKKDVRLKARAATNLSFLYFLEGDMAQASKYANLAVKHDRYNAKALVNMGNCLMDRGEFERAKELYLEAIGVEADCVEAIFNLGLVNKQLGVLHEALQAFEKLHTLVSSAPEVIFQIASLHEALGNYKLAAKYFNILITKVPTDPGALARLGEIFAKDEDDTQAFHYHSESYRYYPVSLEVVSWLGVWFVKNELYEKAIEFFERASEIQPSDVKWKLMVASCHRRKRDYGKAIECYEIIHAQHPEDPECLRYLVALSKDLGRKHDHYESKLLRIERARAAEVEYDERAYGGETDYAGGADTEVAYSKWASDPYQAEEDETAAYTDYRNMKPAAAAEDAAYYRQPHAAARPGSSMPEPDRGFGSSTDRFAAPNAPGSSAFANDRGGGVRDDDFADADLSDLLTD